MFFVFLDDETIHSPYPDTVKIMSGKIKLRPLTDSFEFEVDKSNPAWDNFKPFKSMIKVVYAHTGDYRQATSIFEGRAIVPIREMDNAGNLRTKLIAESKTAYFNDSVQTNYYQEGNDVRAFLSRVINVHNLSMINDVHKRFKVGEVTVTDINQDMKRYINDGDTSIDVIRSQLLEPLGGVIRVREETDGTYIDYLQEIGEISSTRIMQGTNLMSISREIDPSQTKSIVKVFGAQLDLPEDSTDDQVKEMGIKRVDISSVNNGSFTIRNEELIAEIGEVEGTVIFEDVEDPNVLLVKGTQWLENQIIATVTHTVKAVDLSLKVGEEYEEFEEFKLFNWYEVHSPLLGIIETLQIVEKTVDIINFNESNFVLGIKSKRLSDYRAMMSKDRAKYMEMLAYQDRAQRLANRRIQKITDDLTDVVDDLTIVQGDLVSFNSDLTGAIGDISGLATQLGQITTMYNDLYTGNNAIADRTATLYNNIWGIGGVMSRLTALENR